MEYPIFAADENIPLVTHHDEDIDYDDYNTQNTIRVDETWFTMSSSKDKPWTLRLKWEVPEDKLVAFYKHLNVTDDPDLVDIDRFQLKNSNIGNTDSLFSWW